MSEAASKQIILTEYQPLRLAREALSTDDGLRIWHSYGAQVAVEFPSPKTGDSWQLTANGWVGVAPVTHDLTLLIGPRVPLSNLFGMLEYAYDPRGVRWLPGMVTVDTVVGVYESLAVLLARQVLHLHRHGLAQHYSERRGAIPAMRGRIIGVPQPPAIAPTCAYSELTVDCLANRIPLWTLHGIMQSGLCGERALSVVRQAYRLLRGGVTLTPVTPDDCVRPIAHQRDVAYAPLHAICRFFLEGLGPGWHSGDHHMLPFWVEMTRLFERFVAAWLRSHLPAGVTLSAQQRVRLDADPPLTFILDIVLHSATTGVPLLVLDTKYKPVTAPSTDDIAQVVSYAQAIGCHDAVLVYPATLARPLDTAVGDIRVRSATYDLSGDLDAGGMALLADLHLPR